MKTIKLLSLIVLTTLFSCNEEDPIILEPIQFETVSNLYAPQVGGQGRGPISGEFTLFDFEAGSVTTDENAWDIGFRGTTIIVNGGVSLGTTDEPARTGNAAGYFTTGGFAAISEVDLSQLKQDGTNGYAIPTGGGNGWYDYTPFPLNLITPRTGGVLVFRTSEGRYAKVEIISYYENAPDNPDSSVDAARYYTFNYVYQPNEGETSFE